MSLLCVKAYYSNAVDSLLSYRPSAAARRASLLRRRGPGRHHRRALGRRGACGGSAQGALQPSTPHYAFPPVRSWRVVRSAAASALRGPIGSGLRRSSNSGGGWVVTLLAGVRAREGRAGSLCQAARARRPRGWRRREPWRSACVCGRSSPGEAPAGGEGRTPSPRLRGGCSAARGFPGRCRAAGPRGAPLPP